MDESDDYVMDPQPAHQTGMLVGQSAAAGQHILHSGAAVTTPSAPISATPRQVDLQIAAQHIMDATASAQDPNLHQSTLNPAAAKPGEPIMKFFGGYPTEQKAPPAATPTPIGSKASFHSLQPKPDEGMLSHAYRSDPINMSSYVDPQYTPGVRGPNEHLALLLNIYNPKILMPLNVTEDETIAIYETINCIRAEKECKRRLQLAAQKEERSLYGGSTEQITPTWQNFGHNLVTGYQQQGAVAAPLQPTGQIPMLPNIPAQRSVGPQPNIQLPQSDVISQQVNTQAQMSQMGQLPRPDNPVLASAFYQAMRDQNTSGKSGVNMDNVRNFMMSQDITIDLKSAKKSDKGSDSTISSGSTSSSTSSSARR